MTFVVIESWTCEQERLLNAQSSVEVEQRYDKRIPLLKPACAVGGKSNLVPKPDTYVTG